MYSILVKEDNILTVTTRERIMQKSKLFDTLRFVVEPTYKGFDMSLCTVLLEYVLPVSKKFNSDILSLNEERHNGFLVYQLPLDTNLTAEAGKVQVQLTFLYSDLDENGASIQRVRKTTATTIDIVPILAWSDVIPDSALTALDQRIIKIDAQIKAINETNAAIVENQVDNLAYDKETSELQLMAGQKPIGNSVEISSAVDKDGIPIVDFSFVAIPAEPNNDGDVVVF